MATLLALSSRRWRGSVAGFDLDLVWKFLFAVMPQLPAVCRRCAPAEVVGIGIGEHMAR